MSGLFCLDANRFARAIRAPEWINVFAASVFIAQATDTPMTLTQQLTLLAVLLLTSRTALSRERFSE